MPPLIIGLVLITLTIIFLLLAIRTSRAKNPLGRWIGVIITGLLTILCVVIGGVTLRGIYWLAGPRGNPVSAVKVASTPAQLAAGQRLAHLCTGCHAGNDNLPLSGGTRNMIGGPGGSGLGTLYAPNLTPGGPLKNWSDGQIIRAIREGVNKDGHALIIMPSSSFHHMSDSEVQSIVAYLRSQPAVTHATPARNMNLIGTLLVGAGLFPTSAQPPITQPVVAPPAGVNATYGRYLVETTGCQECHGEDLAGGKVNGGGPPPGPNLTLIVPKWTEADFVTTIHTGIDPNGRSLRPDMMPWKEISAAYSDTDLQAIYTYLHGFKPIDHSGG